MIPFLELLNIVNTFYRIHYLQNFPTTPYYSAIQLLQEFHSNFLDYL